MVGQRRYKMDYINRDLHYKISELEKKVENLQSALFETKKQLVYNTSVHVFYVDNNISIPTVDEIAKADEFASNIKIKFEDKIWKKVLEIK
tara:strand:+ start:33 stop:305 length:273 start_codon:yes stop_codon:yes gene_type:complete